MFKTRQVRALQDTYCNHVYRKEGDVFAYSGAGNPAVFYELSDETEQTKVSPSRRHAPAPPTEAPDTSVDLLM